MIQRRIARAQATCPLSLATRCQSRLGQRKMKNGMRMRISMKDFTWISARMVVAEINSMHGQ